MKQHREVKSPAKPFRRGQSPDFLKSVTLGLESLPHLIHLHSSPCRMARRPPVQTKARTAKTEGGKNREFLTSSLPLPKVTASLKVTLSIPSFPGSNDHPSLSPGVWDYGWGFLRSAPTFVNYALVIPSGCPNWSKSWFLLRPGLIQPPTLNFQDCNHQPHHWSSSPSSTFRGMGRRRCPSPPSSESPATSSPSQE